MAGETDGAWVRDARERLVGLWFRRGVRLAARLDRQHLFRDPADDLMTLAARRLLPVPGGVARPLPTGVLERRSRAFCRLPSADRALLWPWAEAAVAAAPEEALREHLAAAWSRLAHNAKAARRWADAPPLEPG